MPPFGRPAASRSHSWRNMAGSFHPCQYGPYPPGSAGGVVDSPRSHCTAYRRPSAGKSVPGAVVHLPAGAGLDHVKPLAGHLIRAGAGREQFRLAGRVGQHFLDPAR